MRLTRGVSAEAFEGQGRLDRKQPELRAVGAGHLHKRGYSDTACMARSSLQPEAKGVTAVNTWVKSTGAQVKGHH